MVRNDLYTFKATPKASHISSSRIKWDKTVFINQQYDHKGDDLWVGDKSYAILQHLLDMLDI